MCSPPTPFSDSVACPLPSSNFWPCYKPSSIFHVTIQQWWMRSSAVYWLVAAVWRWGRYIEVDQVAPVVFQDPTPLSEKESVCPVQDWPIMQYMWYSCRHCAPYLFPVLITICNYTAPYVLYRDDPLYLFWQIVSLDEMSIVRRGFP
jgi:hypothetical protein